MTSPRGSSRCAAGCLKVYAKDAHASVRTRNLENLLAATELMPGLIDEFMAGEHDALRQIGYGRTIFQACFFR
jgi:hypothetical protein